MSTYSPIFTVSTQHEFFQPVPNAELVLEPDCAVFGSAVKSNYSGGQYTQK